MKSFRYRKWYGIGLGSLITFFGLPMVWSAPIQSIQHSLPPHVTQWTVSQDGTGQYISIQEAIDAAKPGDTIWIKAGTYAEDVTVHSKDHLKIVGEGMDLVVLSGLKRVGTLHIGKWPYGARNVEIHGLTVNQHGGLGVGIFNGGGILLKNIHVKGMVFVQQVDNVHLESCNVGGSETTGIAFADSKATLTGNFIHDNDHGIAIGGKSQVLVEQNVITRSLFEAVMVSDHAKSTLLRNTIVRNGGGVAFRDSAEGEVHGNILVQSKVGFLFSPKSRTNLSFNALHDNAADYRIDGSPNVSVSEVRGETDVHVSPAFVGPDTDDFRLPANTPLVKLGGFSYLGALPPVDGGE